MPYVDIDYVKIASSMPPEDIDAVMVAWPGYFEKICVVVSRIFDAKLAKRYATPFVEPVPEAVRFNVAREVAWRLWLRRGFNPSALTDQTIQADHQEAMDWLKEAADPERGQIELPLREDLEKTGVTRAGPLAYHEASPYVWTTLQRSDASVEDEHE